MRRTPVKKFLLSAVLALFGGALFAPDADACGRRRCGKSVVVVKSKVRVATGGCAGGVCR